MAVDRGRRSGASIVRKERPRCFLTAREKKARGGASVPCSSGQHKRRATAALPNPFALRGLSAVSAAQIYIGRLRRDIAGTFAAAIYLRGKKGKKKAGKWSKISRLPSRTERKRPARFAFSWGLPSAKDCSALPASFAETRRRSLRSGRGRLGGGLPRHARPKRPELCIPSAAGSAVELLARRTTSPLPFHHLIPISAPGFEKERNHAAKGTPYDLSNELVGPNALSAQGGTEYSPFAAQLPTGPGKLVDR